MIYASSASPNTNLIHNPDTMKAFFLLALLALAASVAFAQYEGIRGEGGYGHCEEGRQMMMMDSCRDYLKQQCTASTMPITWPWKRRMSSCQALRQRCCQQLAQMAPRCRCRAICRAFQEIQGELGGFSGSQQSQMTKVRQMAKRLPSMCNMYPSYCHIPTTGGCY